MDFPLRVVLDDGLLLAGDDLDTAHEDVADDSDADEEVDHGYEIEGDPQPEGP